jgi:hypothetical protein
MTSDAESSVLHLQSVLALANRVAAFGIAIYEHRYAALDFGSWEIVAGTRKNRIRFRWDGRDATLTIEQAVSVDSRTALVWKPIESEETPGSQCLDPLHSVERFLREALAA